MIGGGSAGVRCARVAASLGARVVLYEPERLGGTCVNLGCIPKKLLAYGARAAHEIAEARAMGWTIPEARLEWSSLAARMGAEVSRLNGVYEKLLIDAGVEIVRARARVEGRAGDLRVRAGDDVRAARHVVLATGGVPHRPAIPGAELAGVSDDFFGWTTLPRSAAVVGGGYVAVEIASVLAAAGVEVHLFARRAVLADFDPDVSTALRAGLRMHGVHVREDCGNLHGIERAGGLLAVTDHRRDRVEVERVILATGRVPRIADLGLEALGVATKDGAIVVGERFETSVPGVYAVGDVIARLELTPVALAEGMLLARTLFGPGGASVRYDLVPTAVFSMPPVGSVGLSEPAARARGPVRVFRTEFRPLKDRLTGLGVRTTMKLVVDADTDRVLGVHVVGEDAPEMIQGFAVALVAGVTKAQLDATIGVHPTAAEELVTMRG